MSSVVKQQLIADLQMAGLAPGTQKMYLNLVERFVRRTGIRPQEATEAQVAEYLRRLIQQGQCQGTIRPVKSALQFVFLNTLQRDWVLFKKGSPRRVASVCLRLPATRSAAACSARWASRCIASAWP